MLPQTFLRNAIVAMKDEKKWHERRRRPQRHHRSRLCVMVVQHRRGVSSLPLPKWRNVANIHHSSGKTLKRYRIADPSTNTTVVPVLPLILPLGFHPHIASQSLVPAILRKILAANLTTSYRGGAFPTQLTLPTSYKPHCFWRYERRISSYFHQSNSSPESAQPGLWFSGIILP